MRNRITTAALTFALALPTAGLIGCANETEGDRTQRRAEKMEDAAMMIKRGEAEVVEGEKMIAGGRALRDQGDRTRGDTMVAEGEAMRDGGRKRIEKGRNLRD